MNINEAILRVILFHSIRNSARAMLQSTTQDAARIFNCLLRDVEVSLSLGIYGTICGNYTTDECAETYA